MPPPPPPPPPPGPGPPGPPPPPMGAPVPKSNVMPDRTGLLGDIAKGKQLKKAVTNDRSAPSVGGGVVSNDSAPKIGRPPTIPGANSGRVSSAPQVESGVSHDGPQLAGIFAGGMPTLKKTSNGIRSNVQGGSLTSQSSRSVSSPSAKPPSVPGGPSRILPPAPGHRPSNSTNLPSSAPPPPPPTAPAPPLPQSFISTTKNANSIPMRPAPLQQVTQNANGPSISAPPLPPPSRPSNNPPSLPTAPPPPLPTTASPGLPNPRASLPSPVRTVTPPPAPPAAPPSSAIPQAPYVPVSNPTRISSYAQPQPPPPPPAPPATGPNLNGLQAALASRTSSQANPSRPNSMSSSVVAPNSFDAATTAPSGVSYSLKPQHVKRVDDSKYKFQPDNALPTVRPFTGCHKPYKSGRPGGTTVPLNLDAYR